MSAGSSLKSEIAGELALQTLAMPKDTNANGDIFGGWLVSQMDLAAGIISKQVTKGRSATVAIENVSFLKPVSMGSTVREPLIQGNRVNASIASKMVRRV